MTSNSPGWSVQYSGVGQNGGSNAGPYTFTEPTYVGRFEAMYSDDTKSRNDKVCEHYTRTTQLFRGTMSYAQSNYANPAAGPWCLWGATPVIPMWCYNSSGGHTYTYGTPEEPLTGIPVLFVGGSGDHRVTIDPPDLSDIVQRGLTAILPGIRPRLSLINSVYELKDFKSMAQSVRRGFRTLKNMVLHSANLPLDVRTRLRGVIERERASFANRGLTLRRLVRGSSSGYLQWMFALAPLIRDIQAIKQACREAPGNVAKLLAGEGKDTVRHWRLPLTNTYVDKDEIQDCTNPYLWVKNTFRSRRVTSYVDPRLHLTLQFCYELESWAKQHAALRGLMDELGLTLSPAILWNAYPWSFIVDWFFGVSRWLDNFNTRNLEPKTRIQRCCVSIHVQRSVRTTVQSLNHATFGCGSSETPVSTVTEEAYYRFPYHPDMYRSISESGLSLTEFSLAAALAGVRIRK